MDNDFNLVFLSRQVSMTDVRYVQLNSDPNLPVEPTTMGDLGGGVTVVGWGDTDPTDDVDSLSDVLLETELFTISNKECEKSEGLENTEYGPIYTDLDGDITENTMCARAEGSDSCQGDSGKSLDEFLL